jgi:hypothetical protein
VKPLRAFLAFCYDFVVGDDWRLALGVVVGLGATWALSRAGGPAWIVLPLAVPVVLGLSLRRAAIQASEKG